MKSEKVRVPGVLLPVRMGLPQDRWARLRTDGMGPPQDRNSGLGRTRLRTVQSQEVGVPGTLLPYDGVSGLMPKGLYNPV